MSEFTGEYSEKAMRFQGETHRQTGERILRRLTLFIWTEPGRSIFGTFSRWRKNLERCLRLYLYQTKVRRQVGRMAPSVGQSSSERWTWFLIRF